MVNTTQWPKLANPAVKISSEFEILFQPCKVGVDPGVGVDCGWSESQSPGTPSTPQPCLSYRKTGLLWTLG